MPIFHVRLSFSWGQNGWVEQFYRQDSTFEAALQAGVVLANRRIPLLAQGVSLYRVRVIMPGLLRGVASADFAHNPGQLPGWSPFVGYDIRLYGAPVGRYSRTYFLRGLPKAYTLPSARPVQFGFGAGTMVGAWLNLLTQGWYMEVEENVGPPWPIYGVQEFADQDRDIYGDPLDQGEPVPGTTSVIASLAYTPPAGAQTVNVTGVRVSPNCPRQRRAVNGRHPVEVLLATGVLWAGDMGGATYVSGGQAQLQQVNYVPVAKWVLRSWGSRKCGPARDVGSRLELLESPVSSPPPIAPPVSVPLARRPSAIVPVERTIRTARDLVEIIFEGYANPSQPMGAGIGVASVSGLPAQTYILFLSGVDNPAGHSAQQWIRAISSAIGGPDPYLQQVIDFIEDNCFPGSNLILSGHSLGGITSEWLAQAQAGLDDILIQNVVTFGSPSVTVRPLAGQSIVRFAVRGDPVTYLSYLQFPNWPLIVLTLIGDVTSQDWLRIVYDRPSPYHVYVDAFGIDDQAFELHNCYPNLSALDDYGPQGFPLTDPRSVPLAIGPTTRIPWVHTR